MDRSLMFDLLADKIEKEVTDIHFNMSFWFRAKNKIWQEGKLVDCGYAACALGTACLMPEFQAMGLKLTACEYPAFKDEMRPEFEDYHGFEAAEKFFRITCHEADHLFSMASYWEDGEPDDNARVTRDRVVARLREYAAHYRTHETPFPDAN